MDCLVGYGLTAFPKGPMPVQQETLMTMSGQLSQAFSTYPAPLETRFKKTLRLNCDLLEYLLSACVSSRQVPTFHGLENQLRQLEHAVVVAGCAIHLPNGTICPLALTKKMILWSGIGWLYSLYKGGTDLGRDSSLPARPTLAPYQFRAIQSGDYSSRNQ